MVLKYTPKHILVMMQKSPPKQGFCLKFDPQNRLSLKSFSKFWRKKKHPFFLKNGILDPEGPLKYIGAHMLEQISSEKGSFLQCNT